MARAPARRSSGSSVWDQYGLRPDRGVIALIAVYLVSWAVVRFGGASVQHFVALHLMLTPSRGIGPEPWQLITSGFVVDRLKSVLFFGVTLLFFGNTLERTLGAGGLWKVYVAGIFGGSLLLGLLGRLFWPDMPMAVTDAAGTAILVAYAIQMSSQQVMAFGAVEMGAGAIAWIWVGIAVVGAVADIFEGHWLEAVMELTQMLGGGLAGWLVITRGHVGRAGRGSGGGMRDTLDRFKMWRLRRRYKVISGGRNGDDDKRYLN
ncbi:MAG TPA: hypothetical protein VHB97_15535 [Polyangia bacterium]|nr:hypothetical protein [Polyangia bacterium]